MNQSCTCSIHYPIKNTDWSIRFTTRRKFQFRSNMLAQTAHSMARLLCVLKGKYWSTWNLTKTPIYSVNGKDIGLEYQDSGPWHSYSLTTSGDSIDECLSEAIIEEVDQDGSTLRSYDLDDASKPVYDLATKIIQDLKNAPRD